MLTSHWSVSPVSLVNDHVFPVELLEDALLPEDHLVAGHAHIPAPGHHGVADESIPELSLVNMMRILDSDWSLTWPPGLR